MKKTIKFFSMAALAMLGAMTVSCSSDNDEFLSEQPVNKKNLVTTTVTVGFDDATTRTLVDNGTKLVNTFAVGDKIVVFYNDPSNNSMRAESEALAAGDIKDGGKTATFTITLTDPKLGNSSGFRAVYPANMAKPSISIVQDPSKDEYTIEYGNLDAQDGTLATLGTKLNLAMYQGWLSDGKVPSFTLENKLTIAKFSIKDKASNNITSDITELTISDGTNSYAVTPSSLSEIYVAMKPIGTSKAITFDAATALNTYNKSVVTSKAFTAGHITPVSLTMYECKALSDAAAEDLGKVIGANGKIFADATIATGAGTTAVAKITYVGSATGETSPYNHGLALALSDANDGNSCYWSTSKSSKVHAYNTISYDDFSTTSESGLQYNSYDPDHDTDEYPAFKAAKANNSTTAPTGCSAWFLPTGYQWQLMITAAGDYATLKTNANLSSSFYWSSTENDANNAWSIISSWACLTKDTNAKVRSAIAF